MTKHYQDYVWREGLPYGISPIQDEDALAASSYKISSDPYHKRVSIEQYHQGAFLKIIYDSALFDFRQLKLGEQIAWQKTTLQETADTALCHIRDQNDRLILVEEYRFEQDRCKECRAYSPHGCLISVQHILYADMKDPFNGVELYDSNAHKVMTKQYEWDSSAKQFARMLKEEWKT